MESLVRVLAGLFGFVQEPVVVQGDQEAPAGMMLVPQKPYMALGTLRQQLLYPVFDGAIIDAALDENDTAYAKQGLLDFPVKPHVGSTDGSGHGSGNGNGAAVEEEAGDAAADAGVPPPPPSDDALMAVLEQVWAHSVCAGGAACMCVRPVLG